MVLARINFDCLEPLRIRQWVIEDIGIRDEPCIAVTEILFGFAGQTAIGCPTVAQLTLFPRWSLPIWITAWEQRKLGELCTISKGHGYSKADIRDAGTPLILYGRLYTQYESRIENVDTFAVEQEGSLLSKGNEVIVPASGETAEDIAVASSVRRSGIIFGGDLNVVTPVSKLDPDYIALAITYSKAHDDLAKRAQGKSVVHVHGNDIAEVEIPYPSESEQKRISTVVLGLDSLITLHQRMSPIFCFCAYVSRTNSVSIHQG